MTKQFDELNYLMTSDFDNMNDASPDKFKELLFKFRYEYRLLNGRNSSFSSEIDKLRGEIKNLEELNKDSVYKLKTKIAELEDELHFLNAKVNKKLTLKERLFGKLFR